MAGKRKTTKKAEEIAALADELIIEEDEIEEVEGVEDFEEDYRPRRRKRRKKKNLLPFFVLFALVGLTWYIVNYKKNNDTKADTKTPVVQKTQKEIKANEQIFNKVKKLIIVPEETPEIIKLEEENLAQIKKIYPFFVLAEADDRLLIFPKSRRAILYRPSRNILVNVGPIVINLPTNQAKPENKVEKEKINSNKSDKKDN